MDIQRFKQVLEILKGLGAVECGIETTEEGTTLVRAVSGDGATIGIYSAIEHLGNPTKHSIGIQSIQGVLSRLELFSDLDKTKIDFQTKDDWVSSITLKQGRRKAEIRTTSVNNCKLPKKLPDFDKVVSAEMPNDFVQMLTKAHQSVKNAIGDTDSIFTIRSVSAEGDYEIEIQKGTHDKFVEPIQVQFVENAFEGETIFAAESILRTLKQASNWSEEKSAIILIDDNGHATIQVGELSVMVISDYTDLKAA